MHTDRDGGWKHISASWQMGGLFCHFGQLLLTAVSGLQQLYDEIVLRMIPSPEMSLASSPAEACICSNLACLVLSAWVVMLYVCQGTRTMSRTLDACNVQIWDPLPGPAVYLHNINSRRHIMRTPKSRLHFICLLSSQIHNVVFYGRKICTNGE